MDDLDPELVDLLAYDGTSLSMSEDGEFVARFDVWIVPATDQIPHGIRYALNMHGPELDGLEDSRYAGLDNAHAIKNSGPARIVRWDHRHRMMSKPTSYNFTTPGNLLADFFALANGVLDELGVKR